MANYQYRICGSFEDFSLSGNGIFAILNKNGSNKKITINSFEINPKNWSTTPTPGVVSAAQGNSYSTGRCSVSGGIPITPLSFDTDSTFPSSILLKTLSTVSSPTTWTKTLFNKQLLTTGLSWVAANSNKNKLSAFQDGSKKDTSIEKFKIGENESFALFCSTFNNSTSLRVSVILELSGTPKRTFSLDFSTTINSENSSIFSIENPTSSGYTVRIKRLSFEEIGTYDSPYFLLVPVGQIVYESGVYETPTIMKMDTNYPNPLTWIELPKNVTFLPLGVPENYLADSSSGSPKGFNYLKTKDFIGPTYRSFFCEIANRPAGLPENLIFNKTHDILIKGSGLTIREGEGLSLVSAAETAAVTTAVAKSGWGCYEYAMTFTVSPKLTPTLTISGLRENSEVRIYETATTNMIAGEENIVSGSFSWLFDPEEYPLVDIHILSLGYENIRLTSQPLSLSDITIPIQQRVDRQYSN